ncbi:VOC family protein [Streptomyces avidinii]|uniref:VOC family protein n=1 Tax=Streptomyces avidinii TaxID=1895 RepID=UPI003865EC8E
MAAGGHHEHGDLPQRWQAVRRRYPSPLTERSLAFQRVHDFRPPQWTVPDHPQQMHIDVMVADLDVAEPQVLALGATLLDGSDKPIGYRVYADPVGHPFCLVTPLE